MWKDVHFQEGKRFDTYAVIRLARRVQEVFL